VGAVGAVSLCDEIRIPGRPGRNTLLNPPGMSDGLTILGGGGWFPGHGRQTACALWRRDDAAIMIDAGTGVVRLVEHPELLDGVTRLDILLTHFHLDHICGTAYLAAIAMPLQARIWGPGELLYGVPTRDLLAPLSHEPIHPLSFDDLAVEVRDLPANELELGDMRVRLRVQRRHSALTLGLRFGDELTWITDTAYDPESADFAAGSTLLAHEAWWTTPHARNPDIHSSAAQAATVARDAGVQELLLIHLPPFDADVAALEAEAGELFPRCALAREIV
jgi:ribonuclease BN (tRNA processing enzyme)